MDGGQSAVQSSGCAQFLEGQVGLFVQQRTQVLPVVLEDAGLAARTMVLRAEVANPAALLEEFLDHPEGHPEATRHGLPCVLTLVINRQQPLTQIQRQGLHAHSMIHPTRHGYSFI
jgi:hypothetical protein